MIGFASGVAIAGWVAAALAGLVAVLARRKLDQSLEAVARASHELRGPLTAARLGLEFGVRTGELTPARLRAIDLELGRAALALEDFAGCRDPTRNVEEHEVDIEELVGDCVEASRALAASWGVELRARWSGGAPAVLGDRVRLAQAAGNLLGNAIEYGGGAVEVHGRSDGANIRIEVTDGGPGLPAPVAELARRPHGGRGRRGRGLAIAAAIAADHGGRLAAAPSDRGARLVLELPSAQRARARRPVIT